MTREEAIYYGIEWLEDEYLDPNDRAFIEVAIQTLEQEPCEDCISRETARRIVDSGRTRQQMIDIILATPPVTPQPKTGHWIYDDDCKEHGHCSECGHGSVDLVDGTPHNYCQKCGAKMVEPESEVLE